MKKLIGLIIVILLFQPIHAFADARTLEFSGSVLDRSTQVLTLAKNTTLIIDKLENELTVLDLSTQQVIWSKKLPAIYDCNVLTNPTKIIVLTSDKNTLQKITFSESGTLLSQQVFPHIKLNEQQKLSWTPAINQEKEKLAVLNKDRIQIYQYPWKKPSSIVTVSEPNDRQYEVKLIPEIKLHHSNVIVKITGDNSTQSQDIYKIINIESKKKVTIPLEWNVNSNFTVIGDELIINTSSKIGNPLGINTDNEHDLFMRYDLKTGSSKLKVTRNFTSGESNWLTYYVNHQLLITNTELNTQELLDRSGNLLNGISIQADDQQDKFIGQSNGKLIFFTSSPNQKAKVITR